jgi:putative transcriptional regulator
MAHMDDALFNELLDAANEALAHHRGHKADLRTTVLPEPPRPMSRAEVRGLREWLGVSQAVFAHCLNVSPKLVQAWEGGARKPDGPALALLRLGERYPGMVFAVREREAEYRRPVATGSERPSRATARAATRRGARRGR